MAKAKTKRKKGNKICAAGIAWAKRTFDKYPSAYAGQAAKIDRLIKSMSKKKK